MHRLSLLIGEILIKLKLRTVWFWLYLSGKLRQELNHKEDSVNISIVYHTHVLIGVHVSYCNWFIRYGKKWIKRLTWMDSSWSLTAFRYLFANQFATIVLKFFAVMPTLVIRPPRKFTSMVSKFMPLLAMTVTFLIMS